MRRFDKNSWSLRSASKASSMWFGSGRIRMASGSMNRSTDVEHSMASSSLLKGGRFEAILCLLSSSRNLRRCEA